MKRITIVSRYAAIMLCAALAIIMSSGCVAINFASLERGEAGVVVGSGDMESYAYNVGRFNEVRVEMLCDIEYYCAESDTVTISMQPNLKEYIVVEESGGTLTVRSTRNISISGKTPVLTISTPELNRLKLAGAGNFTTRDTITAESFTLSIDGAGSGRAELDVNNLKVNIGGTGDYTLSGRADDATFEMDGAGMVDALSLQTRFSGISISGIGTVKLSCSDRLRINADGLGTVEYIGSPSMELDSDGLVNVRKVG